MGKRLPKKIWDLDSGKCPNGHLLQECHKVRRSITGGTWNVCKKREAERIIDNDYIRGIIKRKKTEGALRKYIGTTEDSGDKHTVTITLVCSHKTRWGRSTIEATPYCVPDDLYCQRCRDWKSVHQVSSIHEGRPALVFYPLESRLKPPVPHVKNAGSGPA